MQALYKYPLEPLNHEGVSIVTKVGMMEADEHDFNESEAGAMYQIIKKRLAYHSVPCTKHLILYLCTLVTNPGAAVLFAHTVGCIYATVEREVTVLDFYERFAEGMPSAYTLSKAWDDQKDEGANHVDYEDTWTIENLKAAA